MVSQTAEKAKEFFSNVRDENDGSFTFECPVCRDAGRPGKRARLYANGAISCSGFVSPDAAANREHCQPIRELLGLIGESGSAEIVEALLGGKLTIRVSPAARGKHLVVVDNCETVLGRDELSLDRAAERARFVASIEVDAAGRAAVAQALMRLAEKSARVEEAKEAADDEKQSMATTLIEIAGAAELVCDKAGDGYALLLIDGHRETWPVSSRGFKRWLAREFYLRFKKAANATAIQDALAVLEAKAVFEGPRREIFLRVGEAEGRIYLDLVDDDWRSVEIDRHGWRVLATPPVLFRRADGMEALPLPERGGSLEELAPFVNLSPGTEEWTLMVASLVMKLHPRGPYPVDVFFGLHGSGKTTTMRFIRRVVDPSVADERHTVRDERDILIAASREWVPCFDNLSKLQDWVSDALCCLATGSALRTRRLYTDTDETILRSTRPTMINSIEEIVSRPDLLDRSILFNIQPLPDGARKKDRPLKEDFKRAHPRILGALLDAAACALRREGEVTLESLPRMADFAHWATAAEPALGLRDGSVLSAYQRNRSRANDLALEADPVAEAVIGLVESARVWLGTAQALLDRLLAGADEVERRRRKELGWPVTPRSLAGRLRRLAPNLKVRGISVEFDIRTDARGSRNIRLSLLGDAPPRGPRDPKAEKVCKTSSEPSEPSENPQVQSTQHQFSDANSDGSGGEAGAYRQRTEAGAFSDDVVRISDDTLTQNQVATVRPLVIETKGLTAASDGSDGSDDVLQTFSGATHPIVAIDTETSGLDRDSRLIGVSICYDGDRADYSEDPTSWAGMMPSADETAVFHNAKFDLAVLDRSGLKVPGRWEDTLIASHLLDENGAHALKHLAKQHLGVENPMTFKEVDKARLLDPAVFREYAKNDARYTRQLWQRFEGELDRQGLRRVYELEKAVVPVVLAMERAGMKLDLSQMAALRAETEAEAARIRAEVFDYAGCQFDINSPQKTAVILFDKLGLPSAKTTKGGKRSVDREALEELRGHRPVVGAILDYREIDKLASCFIATLPGFADAGGRVHPEFKQLGAKSGRFSCSNPNVQQIPSRSALGKRLRQAFSCEPGHKLVVADYSQIELRVLAHYSRDPLLLAAYSGETERDLHTLTASQMFKVAETEVTKDQRTVAKMVNFGIAYGVTSAGLFGRLNAMGVKVSEGDCLEFVRHYFETYRGVDAFLESVARVIRTRGYVHSLSGRRRRLRGETQRELRQAKNHIIQASAADIAKDAMVRLHAALPGGARLVAMVHDEFIVECQDSQAEEVRALMVEVMQAAPEGFSVPLKVEAKIAASWGDAK